MHIGNLDAKFGSIMCTLVVCFLILSCNYVYVILCCGNLLRLSKKMGKEKKNLFKYCFINFSHINEYFSY